jgi:RHS repeat-associated protein
MTSINGPSLGGTAISFPACPTAQGMPNPGAANATPDLNDLFSLELKYDALQANIPGTTNKNGNISQVIWKVRGRERQAYSLTYDYLNRMTAARYDNLNDAGTAVNNTNAWNENLSYDIRGNINTLTRTGKYKTTPTATCWTDGQIDNLAYTYNANTNRLQKIADTAPVASIAQGWNNTAGAASTAQYGYDANGNMTTDPYKGMSITYNFLNLPTRFTFTGNKIIDVIYDGGGRKLRKTVTDNGTVQYVQNYVGGIEYRTNSTVSLSLESIYHGEGRVFNTNTGTITADALRYEYAIRDHLGNTRLMFTDKNADGKIDITTTASTEVLQENHYYPFGMNMSGPWQDDAAARNNQYLYNGKELNEDFGLGLYDYGARWYDASLGRWWSPDPLAEKYRRWSGYNYGVDNPVRFIDPDGMGVDDFILTGEAAQAYIELLKARSGLQLSYDEETGNVCYDKEDKTGNNKLADLIKSIINDDKATVNVNAVKSSDEVLFDADSRIAPTDETKNIVDMADFNILKNLPDVQAGLLGHIFEERSTEGKYDDAHDKATDKEAEIIAECSPDVTKRPAKLIDEEVRKIPLPDGSGKYIGMLPYGSKDGKTHNTVYFFYPTEAKNLYSPTKAYVFKKSNHRSE